METTRKMNASHSTCQFVVCFCEALLSTTWPSSSTSALRMLKLSNSFGMNMPTSTMGTNNRKKMRYVDCQLMVISRLATNSSTTSPRLPTACLHPSSLRCISPSYRSVMYDTLKVTNSADPKPKNIRDMRIGQ